MRVNDLAALPQPLVLVLDDYHVIVTPAIHQALAFLVDHLPPQIHLVIATRSDPALPLARLRARGQLTELREADLRFTPAEAAALFNQVMGLALSAADVAALEARTEGWIAGLQLAALSLQGHPDAAAFVQSFAGSHRYVLDYLLEEVFHRQPETVQAFLLQTAILDRLTGPLCDAVLRGGAEERGSRGEFSSAPRLRRTIALLPCSPAQETLEYLETTNLFIVPLDDERQWYRYHRLFADLLRARLRQQQPGLAPLLHRRASAWYEAHNHTGDAVRHALDAGDFERVADLVESAAWSMVTRGELTTLLGWLDALPADRVRARPRLGVYRAWALALAGQLDAVEPGLSGADAAGMTGEAAAVRAYAARLRGDAPGAISHSRQALAHLPVDERGVRGAVALNLAVAHWMSGDLAATSRAATEAIAICQEAGDRHLALIATTILGQAQEEQGRLHRAAATYRQALALTAGQPGPFAGLAHVGLAGSLCEWNELEQAAHHAQAGIDLGRRGGNLDTLQAGGMTLARVRQAQGDVAQAVVTLEQTLSLAEPEGFVRVFLDEGPAMARLLAKLKDQDGRLFVAFQSVGREKADQSAICTPSVQSAIIESLSDRELEVLRLIAAGRPNRAIAQELVVAVSTVKSHANHIYAKLGVQSRTEAVARARELGLL